MIEKSKFK